MRKRFTSLKCSVLEVALASHCLGIVILAQNVFVQLHIGTAEIPEPCCNPLFALHHFFSEVIGIDVDANCADDAEFLAQTE